MRRVRDATGSAARRSSSRSSSSSCPFVFIVLTALKDRREASRREFSLAERHPPLGQPRRGHPDPRLHAGHRLHQLDHPDRRQRRRCSSSSAPWSATCCSGGRRVWTPIVNFFVLAGLIIPPAVVPTIWVLQGLNLFKTLHGMILIEVAYGLSFTCCCSGPSSPPSRASSTRPRSWTAPGRCASSSRSSCRCCGRSSSR